MPQVYRKQCSRCKAVFETRNNKGCPACGSPDFRFTDQPVTRLEVAGKLCAVERCGKPDEKRAALLVAKYHPEVAI